MRRVDFQQPGNGVACGVAAPTQIVAHLLFVETLGFGEAPQGAVPHPNFGLHPFRVHHN